MTSKDTPFDTERLLEELLQLPDARVYVIGFSGGADSTALLHAMSRLDGIKIRAVHVNHGLHSDANRWQAHCEAFCSDIGIELTSRRVTVGRNAGAGLEAEARKQRYDWIASSLEDHEVFLTAHHRDDQAETLILNLARGSGVDGLAGMPPFRPLGYGWLARPLLRFSMSSLRDYLLSHGLSWIEDPSNQDPDFDRNFVRQQVLPLLETRWTGIPERLADSARYCREASETLASWADQELETLLVHPRVLHIGDQNPAQPGFRLLLRQWLRNQGAHSMPARRMKAFCQQIMGPAPDSHPQVQWSGWTIHWFNQSLWLQETTSISPCPEQPWDGAVAAELGPVVGRLAALPTLKFDRELRIGPRRGGERVKLAHHGTRRKVKDLLREAGVPPWLRASIPLLFEHDQVLAVGDQVFCVNLRSFLDKHGVTLRWQASESVLDYVHRHYVSALAVTGG